jgi:acyl carrier protein
VKAAIVVVRGDLTGEKCLVAYVIPETPSDLEVSLDAAALRAHLRASLPEYMVPSAFVMLEHFPLTPNGKFDRRALPAPGIGAFVNRPYAPPKGETEETLAGIWQELLRVERVGRDDNFFELGGQSLHVMRLVVQVTERLMLSPSVPEVFQNPTVQQMAEIIERLRPRNADSPGWERTEFEEGIL